MVRSGKNKTGDQQLTVHTTLFCFSPYETNHELDMYVRVPNATLLLPYLSTLNPYFSSLRLRP